MTDVPDWPRVWALAKKHGLAQFVYLYVSGLPADMRPDDELQKSISKYYASMVGYSFCFRGKQMPASVF